VESIGRGLFKVKSPAFISRAYANCKRVMIGSAIDNHSAAKCELVAIFFSPETGALPKSIANYARKVYGQNVVIEGTVRQ
jgi:hypothetical protein